MPPCARAFGAFPPAIAAGAQPAGVALSAQVRDLAVVARILGEAEVPFVPMRDRIRLERPQDYGNVWIEFEAE